MKKISGICLGIFSIGVVVSLFAGGATLLGYVTALIIGGDVAPLICSFIFTKIFPVIIRVTSICVLFGLIGMYLNKTKALSVDSAKTAKQ